MNSIDFSDNKITTFYTTNTKANFWGDLQPILSNFYPQKLLSKQESYCYLQVWRRHISGG
jgi:hypothetical protein